jgi:acetyltransferase-like isoleucine patch superfamily enzyme
MYENYTGGSFAHETVCVDKGATIGERTKVWHWTHIREGAKIGTNCVIGQNCYIDNVQIGNNVHIQNNVSVYELVTLEDDVFVGPSVVFTNDKRPPSGKENWLPTLVKKGASIGANATIVCGVIIGKNARIGANNFWKRIFYPRQGCLSDAMFKICRKNNWLLDLGIAGWTYGIPVMPELEFDEWWEDKVRKKVDFETGENVELWVQAFRDFPFEERRKKYEVNNDR